MIVADAEVGAMEITAPPMNDAAIFEALFPALRRFAVAVCPAEADPDDLVQDATARALRGGPLHRLDDPGAYLRRAIVNLASNERRRLGRLRRALSRQGPADDGPATSYPSDVDVLLQLSASDRAVLWLADVERVGFDEVATTLGCSPDAARARATRARRRLRALLAEDPS